MAWTPERYRDDYLERARKGHYRRENGKDFVLYDRINANAQRDIAAMSEGAEQAAAILRAEGYNVKAFVTRKYWNTDSIVHDASGEQETEHVQYKARSIGLSIMP